MKPTDLQLRHLLLHRLAAEEATVVEDAILLEDGTAERLREAEFDLLDDYARDRLDLEDRARVEGYLLTGPERLISLRVTRALDAQAVPASAPRQGLRSAPRRRRRWWPNALALGCLAASLGAILWIPLWRGAPRMASAPRPALAPPQARQVLTLLEDRSRSGAGSSMPLTVKTDVVCLQLEVPEQPSEAYSIEILDDRGRITYHASSLPGRSNGPYRFVETWVPAPALAPGPRTIVLRDASAAPAQAAYSWRIDGLLMPGARNNSTPTP